MLPEQICALAGVTDAVIPPETVKTTSSVFTQFAESVAVKRTVADELVTCTSVGPKVVQFEQEVGVSMVAVPEVTLHAIDTMGWIPAVALPLIVNVVEPSALHLV